MLVHEGGEGELEWQLELEERSHWALYKSRVPNSFFEAGGAQLVASRSTALSRYATPAPRTSVHLFSFTWPIERMRPQPANLGPSVAHLHSASRTRTHTIGYQRHTCPLSHAIWAPWSQVTTDFCVDMRGCRPTGARWRPKPGRQPSAMHSNLRSPWTPRT